MGTRGRLRLEWLDPKELQDNPHNFRRHGSIQTQAMRAITDEVGWVGALLLNDRNKRLLDGHLRKKTARKGEKVPVLCGWFSEKQERKILATFDGIGSMAEIDRIAFENLIGSLRFESSALDAVLQQILGDAPLELIRTPGELSEPVDQIERADELRKKWKTATGQLWQAGAQSLICGDARDPSVVNRVLPRSSQSIDETVADGPYGVDYSKKTQWMQKHGAQRRRAPIENDSLAAPEIRKLFSAALKNAAARSAPGASIYATVPSGTLLPIFIAALEDSGFSFKHSLVWLKNSMVLGRSDYHYKHETILYGWLENGPHYFIADRTQSSVLEYDRPQASPFHPTTKPIGLIARLIMNNSRKGDSIYDPFCGSGTTLLASEQLERMGFGVELDPGFVAVALERLSLLGLKPRLIEGPRG